MGSRIECEVYLDADPEDIVNFWELLEANRVSYTHLPTKMLIRPKYEMPKRLKKAELRPLKARKMMIKEPFLVSLLISLSPAILRIIYDWWKERKKKRKKVKIIFKRKGMALDLETISPEELKLKLIEEEQN